MLKIFNVKERRREKLEQSKVAMVEFSSALSDKMAEILTLGKEIVAFGDPQQCQSIMSQYKFFENCKYSVDKMILDVKIAESMKSVGEMSSVFSKSMGRMAKTLSAISKDKQLKGAVRTFAKTTHAGEVEMMRAQASIEKTQAIFETMTEMVDMPGDTAQLDPEEDARIRALFLSAPDVAPEPLQREAQPDKPVKTKRAEKEAIMDAADAEKAIDEAIDEFKRTMKI